jgi:uncharacterized protein involved in exopolysaccharide biosynthesis
MTSTATDGPSAPSKDDEISLIEIVNAVLRNWRTVVILPLVLAMGVGISTLRQKRAFAATASFVPQAAETRSVSGAAALAAQFGVSLGSERAGQSPQFYEGLLRTDTILRRAVETEYQFSDTAGQSRRGTLIQYWKLNELQEPPPAWRRAVDRLRGTVGTTVRRETGVIELRVSSGQPLLAEQIAARLLALLNDYNLEVRQARAREETRFISGRLTDVQREVQAAEDTLERVLRRNREFRNSPELTFQHDRLQRQVTARQEVYTSLLRGQEQARLDGMRDTPVLQVIDSPAGSAQPQSRKVVLRTLIAFMLGVMLAVFLAMAREAGRRGRRSKDPHYREFEDLAREIWSDLRHPRQWLGKKEKRVGTGAG